MRWWPVLLALAALAAGFVVGLTIRGRQARAAEDHARRALQQYQSHQRDDVIRQRESAARDQLRAHELALIDSMRRAATDSLAAVRARARVSDQRAAERLAAAATAADKVAVYEEIYPEAIRDRDNALLVAQEQMRVAARLRVLATEDSLTIRRERARGDAWKATADSLAGGTTDLLDHRPSGITIEGFGAGAAAGALAVTAVCLLTPVC